jgi:hypothetical protein
VPVDSASLVALALRVIAEAVLGAEADCHQIIRGAELRAAEILQQAHEDATALNGWLVGRTPDFEASIPIAEPSQSDDTVDDTASPEDHSDEEIGAEFFASFADDGPDRWSFMDSDDLVGVGPAVVRRLFRRPGWARDQPTVDE